MMNDQHYGWLCARCGKSYAPNVEECQGCNARPQCVPAIGIPFPVTPGSLPIYPTITPYPWSPSWRRGGTAGDAVGVSTPLWATYGVMSREPLICTNTFKPGAKIILHTMTEETSSTCSP